MEKKNTGLIVLVVVLCLLVVGLGGYIVYDKMLDKSVNDTNNKDKNDNIIDKNVATKLNETIVIDINSDKTYNKDVDNHSVTYSSKSLKVDDKTIVELEEGAYYLYQVSFYDDIIITSQSFSLGHWFDIYDYDGNVIKEINLFRDNENRLFHAYLRYSDDEIFNVSNSGVISFVGTKHVQGDAGTYLTDNGNEINILYDKYDIDDDSVVEGIFEISYLGNNNFSDIKCVKTIETFKEFKSR